MNGTEVVMYMSRQNDEMDGIKMFRYFLSYVMCLPFILKFIILLFIFEGLVSLQCVAEVLVFLVISVAHDGL